MTPERNSSNLNEALFFISGIFVGTAIGLGAAEVIKDPSKITNLSKKVKPILLPKMKVA